MSVPGWFEKTPNGWLFGQRYVSENDTNTASRIIETAADRLHQAEQGGLPTRSMEFRIGTSGMSADLHIALFCQDALWMLGLPAVSDSRLPAGEVALTLRPPVTTS